MIVLGLNVGHNSTAALLIDGKIVGCVSEERFSRIKNHFGFPKSAVKYLLSEFKVSVSDLDCVVLDNQYVLENDPFLGKQLLEFYTKKRFVGRRMSYLAYNFPKVFKFYKSLKKIIPNDDYKNIKKEISDLLKISENKIFVVDHHLIHSYSVLSNIGKEDYLIFTLDGEGAGICASVSIYKDGKLRRISTSKKDASLGYLYAAVTACLGMKPMEHEFKVMGLAPYAKKDKVDSLYQNKFNNLIWTEGMGFKSKFDMTFSDVWYYKNLKFERFDNISGAVQKIVEERVCEWIKYAIKKTGIKNIALSGGVFMNVKANQKIREMPEVDKMFVMPSCGDESNAIGSCFYGYKKACESKNQTFYLYPIKDLYLGPLYDNKYIENFIRKNNLNKKYVIKKVNNVNKEIAKLLSKGEIVARCSGKSEWGARALGNRSILANPKNPDTIRILNETIKDRDFWMPFTPSILDKYAKKYFENPKNMFAPYMVITFNSTDEGKKDLPAAMHPYDQTLRPQVVTKEYNPEYYQIIEEFKKLTGIGGLLNTSFNLHGEPNVLTPEDAIHTVENSSLKYLAMEDYLFEKRAEV